MQHRTGREESSQARIISPGEPVVPGYGAYFVLHKYRELTQSMPATAPLVVLGDEFEYLLPGDVVRVSAEHGRIRTLYRRESKPIIFWSPNDVTAIV